MSSTKQKAAAAKASAKQETAAAEAPAQEEPNDARTEPGRAPAPHDKHLAEVREIRAANEARIRSHSRTEINAEIRAATPGGDDAAKPVTVKTVDGKVYLNSHGEKVLDRDGLVDLQRACASAFQAVS